MNYIQILNESFNKKYFREEKHEIKGTVLEGEPKLEQLRDSLEFESKLNNLSGKIRKVPDKILFSSASDAIEFLKQHGIYNGYGNYYDESEGGVEVNINHVFKYVGLKYLINFILNDYRVAGKEDKYDHFEEKMFNQRVTAPYEPVIFKDLNIDPKGKKIPKEEIEVKQVRYKVVSIGDEILEKEVNNK